MTTFRLGDVWQPKECQKSKNQVKMKHQERRKEEQRWKRSGGIAEVTNFLIITLVISSPTLFLYLGRKWVVCPYVKWTNVFALGIRAPKNPKCNTFLPSALP